MIFLLSANRPTRYLIVLVPPMSLIAALALDRWLRPLQGRWPQKLGRSAVLVLLAGVTYLIYQLLAAVHKVVTLVRYQTNLVDSRVIADGLTLFRLLAIALALGLAVTLLLLRLALQRGGRPATGPTVTVRNSIAVGLVAWSLIANSWQYLNWARAPEYSMVVASQQIESVLGEEAVLGGPYAHVLTLENRLPTILFYGQTSEERLSRLKFTHLAVEADSLLGNGPFNDEKMYALHPELMQRSQLVTTYTLRGYLVKLYAIMQQE
jgi:hypothetical protein